MRAFNYIILTAVAAVAAIVATPARGQEVDAMSGQSVRIQGTQPVYKMDAKEFQDFRGSYLLSNGQRMTLWTAQKRFYAAFDGQPQVEIVPVRHNVFVARGTGLRLSFDQFHQNRTHDVVLTGPQAMDGRDRIRLSAR